MLCILAVALTHAALQRKHGQRLAMFKSVSNLAP